MRNPLRQGVRAVLCGLTGLVLAGCVQPVPQTHLSAGELVGRYNNNAAMVGRLWARARIEVVSSKGSWGSTLLAPNGTLLMAKGDQPLGPHHFALIGAEAGRAVFKLGSSPDEPGGAVYYLWFGADRNGRAWYGLHKYAGGPGIEEMPIDPYQLLAVLGIFELPEDFTKLPTVAMAMSKDPCAYVLTYIDRQPITGDILFRREVYFNWSDKDPPRPFKVDLFAPDGRRLMTARLKDYRSIETGKEGIRPEMPTDIRIESVPWPGQNELIRSIHIVLSNMTTAPGKGSPQEACLFRGADLPAGIETIRVDRNVGTSGGEK